MTPQAGQGFHKTRHAFDLISFYQFPSARDAHACLTFPALLALRARATDVLAGSVLFRAKGTAVTLKPREEGEAAEPPPDTAMEMCVVYVEDPAA